jgi:hypothetical protein
MKARFAACTIFALAVMVSAAVGQDGISLMKVEVGARPAGMAGAFVSIAGDPVSPVYNPALAVGTKQFTATLGYNTLWDNIDLGSVHIILPYTRLLVHAGIRYANIGGIEGRTQPTVDPNEVFDVDARDVSFKAGASYRITDRLAFGLAAGWFVEKIDVWRGSVLNYDMGVYYRHNDRLAFGAASTNLGEDFTLSQDGLVDSREIALPTIHRVGGSYTYDRYTGALDLVIVDDDAHVHAGAEGRVHESLALRGGWMLGYDSKNLTAGVSFTKRNFIFDYAFVPYTNGLGSSHLFNLTVTL